MQNYIQHPLKHDTENRSQKPPTNGNKKLRNASEGLRGSGKIKKSEGLAQNRGVLINDLGCK